MLLHDYADMWLRLRLSVRSSLRLLKRLQIALLNSLVVLDQVDWLEFNNFGDALVSLPDLFLSVYY